MINFQELEKGVNVFLKSNSGEVLASGQLDTYPNGLLVYLKHAEGLNEKSFLHLERTTPESPKA